MYDEWKLALGYGINDNINLQRPRVCGSHFHNIDIIKRGNSFSVSRKNNSACTRNSARIRGNDSRKMPPIPSQTYDEVLRKKYHYTDESNVKHYHVALEDKAIATITRNANMSKEAVRSLVHNDNNDNNSDNSS